MGGAPKGLIKLGHGETILERTLRIVAEAKLEALLVGNVDAYDAVTTVRRIRDNANVQGPLSGLHALLNHVVPYDAIVIGCDMPFLSVALLQRLATESPEAIVLAPRSSDGDKWEPLCARYRPSIVRPLLSDALEHGARSFQQVFKQLPVTELHLSAQEREATLDWDAPEDVKS